jgi:hypothetical protein
MFGFDQFVDQSGGRRETNTPFLTARGYTEPGKQVSFTGSARDRNIMPMDLRSSRFTMSFTRYTDRVSGFSEG